MSPVDQPGQLLADFLDGLRPGPRPPRPLTQEELGGLVVEAFRNSAANDTGTD